MVGRICETKQFGFKQGGEIMRNSDERQERVNQCTKMILQLQRGMSRTQNDRDEADRTWRMTNSQETRSTYDNVDALAGAGRPDKQTRLLMSDQQTHQPRVSHCVDGWHNDLSEHRVAWYRRNVRQRRGPFCPLSNTALHHLVIVDESISWDRRHAGTHRRLRRTREIQTGSNLFRHSTLRNSHITTHNRFTALLLRPPGWASARSELLDFMVQRQTHRPSGWAPLHPDYLVPTSAIPPYSHINCRKRGCPLGGAQINATSIKRRLASQNGHAEVKPR